MAQATAAQPITVGSTPTWTATSPTQATSSAAASAPAASPPRPPAIRTCSAGPVGSASPSPGAWKAPASTAPPWPASWPQAAGSWWRSTDPTARPAAAAASPTRPMPRLPPARSRPARPPWPQGRNRAGGDDPGAAGRPTDRDPGPHPGQQRPRGAGGHRPGRAARAAAGPASRHLVAAAAALVPGPITSPLAAAMLALGTLARRHQASASRARPDRRAGPAHRHRRPKLVALLGIGHDHAGALLVTAGDNPQRLRSQACFAMLGGSSPIQATVGQDRPAPPQPGW
jgi:hypothetical protein